MPLSGSNFSSVLFGLMAARGNVGPDLQNFCDAVGDGTINASLGAPFATADTGSTPGAGVGSGVGITLSPGSIAPVIESTATGLFGGAGSELPLLAADIETACIAEFALATLTSTHGPVYIGSGSIVGGLPSINAALLSPSILAAGVSKGFIGVDWANFALAIATGEGTPMPTAVGTVTITGAGGPPVPGAGVGSGVIS